MREILFRGKTAFGAWVHGDLIHRQVWKSKFEVIRSDDNGFDNYTEYEVATETIGQYTGLTDKNGKKIFEGDIIECWSEGVQAKGTVQQNRGGLWIIYPAWQKRIMWGLCPKEDGSTDVEIIGNIHDDPELVEELP